MGGGDMCPILPVDGKRCFIISALPYVNNVPHHLGNIFGCVLDADVYARYCRLRGYNPIDICGIDEYSTATETKAVEDNCSPKEICDKCHAIHKQVYEWFNISFDEFGRTSTPQQTEFCQSVFHKLMDNHGLSENTMQQLCCDTCQKFLADHLVEGACPTPGCNYDSARGDQCEKCSQLLNPTDFKDPKCKACQSSPRIRDTDHLFLELPLLKDKLEEYINKMSQAGSWIQNVIHVTNGWLEGELRSRCITRDLKWGVPVPHEKYEDKKEGSSAQSHREANPKGKTSNVTQSGAWDNRFNDGYTISKNKHKTNSGLPAKNVDLYQAKDGFDVRLYSAWEDEKSKQYLLLVAPTCRCNQQWRDPMIDEARISLLNEGCVGIRAQDIVGGGGSLTVQQAGGNIQDVGHYRNASREFPTSAAGSKAPLYKETKLLEVSNNGTPASNDLQHFSDMYSREVGSAAQPPRAADLKGQLSNVTESGAWFYTVIGYTPSEIIWKIKNGLPTKNVEFYQEPAINEGWVDIRPQPREDDVQVYYLESDHTPCRGPMINEAKISLLNEDWVIVRAQEIVRADNEQIYGGDGSSTVVQQTGGNIEDVGHFRNATPASDQLSTRQFSQREQLGGLYSWLGRVKQSFLRWQSSE